jgi:hypothetical protein
MKTKPFLILDMAVHLRPRQKRKRRQTIVVPALAASLHEVARPILPLRANDFWIDGDTRGAAPIAECASSFVQSRAEAAAIRNNKLRRGQAQRSPSYFRLIASCVSTGEIICYV